MLSQLFGYRKKKKKKKKKNFGYREAPSYRFGQIEIVGYRKAAESTTKQEEGSFIWAYPC